MTRHPDLDDPADRDALTGLSNRQRMDEDIPGIQSRLERYGHRFCVAKLDMDQFADYNETHGAIAGDQILVEVGRTIVSEIRPGDTAYRLDGGEFLVVYPDQRLGTAAVAAERVRRRVSRISSLAGLPGSSTLSAGIAEAGRTDRFDNVVRRADIALDRAKGGGGDQVVVQPHN